MRNYTPILYPLLADMPITTDANIKACEYRIKGLYNAALPLTGKIPCNAVRHVYRGGQTWDFACYDERGIPFAIYVMYTHTAKFMVKGLSYQLMPKGFRTLQPFNIAPPQTTDNTTKDK